MWHTLNRLPQRRMGGGAAPTVKRNGWKPWVKYPLTFKHVKDQK
jgi:hypothetical protein